MNMVQLKNVKKNYGSFMLDCSLEVASGSVTGLIGQNGMGKSTTFKAILNLISIDGGEIRIIGKAPDKLTPADKEKIGVVLSDSGFSEYLTIQDVAAVMKSMYSSFSPGEFSKKCSQFGLPGKKQIKQFSTGMKAKLKLLAAMSHGAELLILDEPTAGLDVVAREELLELLRDYLADGEERTVVISSHISGDLEHFCDDIYMIHDGKIVMHEETDELLSEYAVLKVSEEQYAGLDKTWIKKKRRESYGYSLLTDQRQYYLENYPLITAEKGSIDDVILMMTKGEPV